VTTASAGRTFRLSVHENTVRFIAAVAFFKTEKTKELMKCNKSPFWTKYRKKWAFCKLVS